LSKKKLAADQEHNKDIQRTNAIAALDAQIATIQKQISSLRAVMNDGSSQENSLRLKVGQLLSQKNMIAQMTPSEYEDYMNGHAKQNAATVAQQRDAFARARVAFGTPKAAGEAIVAVLKSKGIIHDAIYVDSFLPGQGQHYVDPPTDAPEVCVSFNFTFTTKDGLERTYKGYIVVQKTRYGASNVDVWEPKIVNIDGNDSSAAPYVDIILNSPKNP
jgi:regulator of replication initiation timing